MKLIMAVLAGILTVPASFAGDTIQLKAELVIVRCELIRGDLQSCTLPPQIGKPLQINLSSPEGSWPGGYGWSDFKVESDGYEFEGAILTHRIKQRIGRPVYKFSFSTCTKRIGETTVLNRTHIGSQVVKDLAKMNEVAFVGAAVTEGKITLIPKLILGSEGADFSATREIELQP